MFTTMRRFALYLTLITLLFGASLPGWATVAACGLALREVKHLLARADGNDSNDRIADELSK